MTYLEFADFGLCDYLGPVYDEAEAPLLLSDATLPRRLAAALPRHDLLALTKLAGEDPLMAHLPPAARRARMRLSAYPAQLRGDWKTWRDAALDPSQRRELDMKRRRLDRTGKPAFELLRDADEITRAFEALRRYRTERFKALGAPDVLDHEVVFTFYRRMAIEGARDGATRTQCLCLDGKPVAVMFGLAQRSVYSMLMVGSISRTTAAFLPACSRSRTRCVPRSRRATAFTISRSAITLQAPVRRQGNPAARVVSGAHRSRPCGDIRHRARARGEAQAGAAAQAPHRHCGERTGRAGLTRAPRLTKAKETTLTAR